MMADPSDPLSPLTGAGDPLTGGGGQFSLFEETGSASIPRK